MFVDFSPFSIVLFQYLKNMQNTPSKIIQKSLFLQKFFDSPLEKSSILITLKDNILVNYISE